VKRFIGLHPRIGSLTSTPNPSEMGTIRSGPTTLFFFLALLVFVVVEHANVDFVPSGPLEDVFLSQITVLQDRALNPYMWEVMRLLNWVRSSALMANARQEPKAVVSPVFDTLQKEINGKCTC